MILVFDDSWFSTHLVSVSWVTSYVSVSRRMVASTGQGSVWGDTLGSPRRYPSPFPRWTVRVPLRREVCHPSHVSVGHDVQESLQRKLQSRGSVGGSTSKRKRRVHRDRPPSSPLGPSTKRGESRKLEKVRLGKEGERGREAQESMYLLSLYNKSQGPDPPLEV